MLAPVGRFQAPAEQHRALVGLNRRRDRGRPVRIRVPVIPTATQEPRIEIGSRNPWRASFCAGHGLGVPKTGLVRVIIAMLSTSRTVGRRRSCPPMSIVGPPATSHDAGGVRIESGKIGSRHDGVTLNPFQLVGRVCPPWCVSLGVFESPSTSSPAPSTTLNADTVAPTSPRTQTGVPNAATGNPPLTHSSELPPPSRGVN